MGTYSIILGICLILAIIWVFVTDGEAIAVLTLIFLIFCFGASFGYNKPKHNKKNHGWYYLKISDSPHVANVHPELDYTLNDTAYINWYSNSCK